MAHSEFPAFTRQEVATALTVVKNPAHYCDQPKVLRTAWQILKADRGQAVDLDRAGPAAHRISRAADRPVHPLHMTAACLARMRAHAAMKRAATHQGNTGGTAA
jgi:hypothetical protein